MRALFPAATALVLSVLVASPSLGQVTNPIPEPIVKRGIAVELRDVLRLPDSRNVRPADQDVAPPIGWARINYVRDLPDGRRFINDSRGILYVVGADNRPQVYVNIAEIFPRTVYNRLSSGLIAFAFHPDFAKNGLFYTLHAEFAPGNPATPNFVPPGYTAAEATYHNIVTEWHATRPTANSFSGTRRELYRDAHMVENLTHPVSGLAFNPTAKPGDQDYGLLYIGGSDHGFSNGGGPRSNNPGQTQRPESVITAILRIDPRSPSVSHGLKGLGDYTIPPSNTFAADNDPKTLGEIYAYGFRNAHRLVWDTDGTMFASDIGMNQVEEINIVHNGGNYGWMKREGVWENGLGTRPGGTLSQLFAMPEAVLSGREKDGFTYPVAMFDHGEGAAVTGGVAYHGKIAALRGKFVFGDILSGRLFAADLAEMKKADDGVPATTAPIQEIQLYVRKPDGAREDIAMRDLISRTMGNTRVRADLFVSATRDGEILLTSRQDGWVRMLVAE